MSNRPLILLGNQGSQHLVVPAVRGCGTNSGVGVGGWWHTNTQCDVTPDSKGLTPVDFTSTYGTTIVTTTDGTGGRGDEPKTSPVTGGKSLDLFTTSCSMGDHAKRDLALDDNGHQLGAREDGSTLCSNQGPCGLTDDTCEYDSEQPCQARIYRTGQYANCAATDPDLDFLKFDEPDGYEYVSSQVCNLNGISNYISLGSDVDSEVFDMDLQACNYNYRKNWDDPLWETPGEIYDASGSGDFDRSLYNSNNIPIKRMECCIGNTITEGVVDRTSPFDYNECPVDTTRYSFNTEGTVGGGVDGIAADNHDYDDKIRAYVPESLMCDGRSTRARNIELTKTPQHWCTYNMQDNFDIANYDDYYSMLTDNHCKEWLKLDEPKDGITSPKYREYSYSHKLKDFYIWISNELANNYELKPSINHAHVPVDTNSELTMSNRSDLGGVPIPAGSNFVTSNDYGKFISLLKIKTSPALYSQSSHTNTPSDSPPLVKMFLNHSDKADRDIFNENMTKFCNRRDIFNFKDYSVDINIPYNSELESTYKDLCACYWDKNIDFTPANQVDDIYQMLHSLSSRSHSSTADQIALDIQDTLDVNRKNQCWYNGCMGNVGGIKRPYKEGPTTDDDIEECPDNCIGIAFSETLLNIQNSILTDTSIDAGAQADAEVNCNQDRSSMSPAPLVSSLSELHRLVDDVEESNPESGSGSVSGSGSGTGTDTGSGSGTDTSNSDKRSIVIKIVYALLTLFIFYKALSFILN
jgi:hypothetical protein